ncbi:MAG: HDOD domain-containing protein [Gammaproteobacteria bacterium]|nr:HDOD domain-containing protein [Gammaproteobacteria bacterium]
MESSIKDWVHRAEGKPLPIMAHSVDLLRKLSQLDDLPLNAIVDAIEQDPGLTVQLFRSCNRKGKNKLQREVTSVQQALMLLGTQPATAMAMQLPLIHKSLNPSARQQLLRTFCRAYHASMQAVVWAKQRHDMTPDEVSVATQLHFLGEMVLAMYAPEKLLEIFQLRAEKNIASEEAQYLVLGFTLDQLSMGLAKAWGLPSLVIDALHGENAQHPRAYGIMLAVQLARGAAIDWYSEKTRKVEEQAAQWLNLPLDQIISESHALAVKLARITHYDGVLQTASLLLLIPVETTTINKNSAITEAHTAAICLIPQLNLIKQSMLSLQQTLKQKTHLEEILRLAAEGMHDGIGLNRVVFAGYDADDNRLHPRLVVGSDNDPVFNRFEVKLKPGTLFYQLLQKPQAICINDGNRQQFWPMIPFETQKLLGTNSFMAMSIFVQGKAAGIFYVDRHTSACQVDNNSYQYFKRMCALVTQALELQTKQQGKGAA